MPGEKKTIETGGADHNSATALPDQAAARAVPPLYADYQTFVVSRREQRLRPMHRYLIKMLNVLGLKSDVRGVCRGTAIRWLEAQLLGDDSVFMGRMAYLRSQSIAVFAAKVKVAKQNAKNKLVGGLEDRRVFDTLAFFESLSLYQKPSRHANVLGVYLPQYCTKQIASIAASDGIHAVGGIACSNVEIISCDRVGLNRLLQTIKNDVDALVLNANAHTTVAMLVSRKGHAAGLVYNTRDKQFTFMDINRWPPIKGGVSELLDRLCRLVAIDDLPLNGCEPRAVFSIQLLITQRQIGVFPSLPLLLSKHGVLRSTSHELTCPLSCFSVLLYFALRLGRADILAAMIKQEMSVDVDSRSLDSSVGELLHDASRSGHVDVVRLLLDYGFLVDFPLANGATPLLIAAECGHIDVVCLLLERHASINKARSDGTTPLMVASQKGYLSVIRALLKAAKEGAGCIHYIDQARVDGATPLFMAAQNGRLTVVHALLQMGANPAIPFIRSAEGLMRFVRSYPVCIQRRMQHQISQINGQSAVVMLPSDIAAIMGYDAVADAIENHAQGASRSAVWHAYPRLLCSIRLRRRVPVVAKVNGDGLEPTGIIKSTGPMG